MLALWPVMSSAFQAYTRWFFASNAGASAKRLGFSKGQAALRVQLAEMHWLAGWLAGMIQQWREITSLALSRSTLYQAFFRSASRLGRQCFHCQLLEVSSRSSISVCTGLACRPVGTVNIRHVEFCSEWWSGSSSADSISGHETNE